LTSKKRSQSCVGNVLEGLRLEDAEVVDEDLDAGVLAHQRTSAAAAG
jgi:hypothetical protein